MMLPYTACPTAKLLNTNRQTNATIPDKVERFMEIPHRQLKAGQF
jgi:hypothetical protein